MKTIKKGKEIVRVSSGQAETLVEKHGYKYCPKQEWKKKVRDKK